MDARRVRRAVAAAVVAAAASAAVALSVAARAAAAGGTPSGAPPPAPVHGAVRAVAAAAAAATPTSPPPALTSFGSCRWQGDYFRAAASSPEALCRLVGCRRRSRRSRIVGGLAPTGGGGGGGGGGATGTNVQVEGVDEADVIKGDGSVQYVVSNGTLHVLSVRRGGADAVHVGSVAVAGAEELLADGSALLVIGRGAWRVDGHGVMQMVTRLTRVDASTRDAPVVTSTVDVQGRVTAARSVGGAARVVVTTALGVAVNAWARSRPNFSDVREAIAASPDHVWVPTYTLRRFPRGGGAPTVTSGPLASCARTYRPRAFAGWTITTVLSLPVGEAGAAGDFGAGAALPGGVAVVSGSGHVYASTNAVYVTTTAVDRRAADLVTDVHAFSTTGASGVYVASTALAGRLLNEWALYERADVLFAATTSSPWSETASSSTLTALKVRGRALETVGTVPRIGVGEAITAVRYVGELAFVVTFREVDPLYAIDLRVPSRMVTLGALKVPGFSRYLHPLAPGLLLGLGVSVGAPGEWRRFAKASLFRVPSAETVDGAGRLAELATWTPPPIARRPAAYGSAWQADSDHRAFLYLPARRLIVAPLDVYDEKGGRAEATLLRVAPGGAGFSVATRITHRGAGSAGARIRRAVAMAGRYLWTVAPGGIEVRDLDTLRVTSRAAL